MKIQYIIEYKGYGDTFQLTTTRNGICEDIDREQAKALHDSVGVWSSIKADVSLSSASHEGITPDEAKYAFGKLKF